MRATLHDRAPNTYYGQWPGEKPLFPGLESPAIAHNELVASARFVRFDVGSEISQGIARRRVGNLSGDQRKICAAGEVAHFRRDHLLTASI
jgi:hypothetical protein